MKPNINVHDPSGVVPKNYPMNPETDDLMYADNLENGLRVLVEPMYRYFESDDRSIDILMVRNRWCVVSDIRIEDDNVYFIGIYADGQKAVRQSSIVTGWLVKKNSIPKEDAKTYRSGPFAGLPKDLGVLSGAKFRTNRDTSLDENIAID